MAEFKGQFFSIVFIGKQNPQILNHNFLVNNAIINANQEPFKSLLAKEKTKPFDEFVSTPLVTKIKYGAISIIVDDSRYNIIDTRFVNKPEKNIIDITKNYFGKYLVYTPLKLGGMNFNGKITFNNIDDEHQFDDILGLRRKDILTKLQMKDARFGMVANFQWEKGTVEIQIVKPRQSSVPATINFNYEFVFDILDSFLERLDDFDKMYLYFCNFLKSLEVVIK